MYVMKKMRTIKTVLAVLLAFITVFGCVGCSKNDDEVVTLVWYLPGSKQDDTQAVCDEVNKITEPEIGVKLDIQYIEKADFTERMQLIMASQDEFDLCFTGFVNPYLNGVRRGGFVEIDDLLDKYGKDLKKLIPDYIWEAAQVDGETYAVPCYQAMTKSRAIYFQKALVDKYNFDVSKVKKMEDIEPFLEKIRDNEPEYFPILLPGVEYFYDDPYKYEETSITNVTIDKTTDKLVFEQDQPERAQARAKIKEWYDKGFIRKDVAVAQATQQTAYACWCTDGYRPGDLKEREVGYGVDLVAAQLTDYYLYRTGATTTMTAISATSKHPEKAMKFLNLLNTNSDVFNLVAYGIEGKHYEKVDDTHIRKLADSKYNPGDVWKYGCMFTGYMLEGMDDDLWDQIKKINDESQKGVLNGFVADTTRVNTIISQMSNITSEYQSLNNGTAADLEKATAEANAKYEKAGKKDLMDFANEVVGDYLKENKKK